MYFEHYANLFGSTTGVWPTMLQAAKRGASTLPLFTLTNSATEKYFHSLPKVELLLHTYTSPSTLRQRQQLICDIREIHIIKAM